MSDFWYFLHPIIPKIDPSPQFEKILSFVKIGGSVVNPIKIQQSVITITYFVTELSQKKIQERDWLNSTLGQRGLTFLQLSERKPLQYNLTIDHRKLLNQVMEPFSFETTCLFASQQKYNHIQKSQVVPI